MSFKKNKKSGFFSKMRKECVHIFKDVIALYKQFIHWNISKILITLCSLILGIFAFIPFILLMILVGFIDPISWMEIMSYILSGSSISLDIASEFGSHPVWLIIMALIGVFAVGAFLLASTYSLLLQANLSLHYIKGKRLKFKKNLYFSKRHIIRFISIISWNVIYLLIPVLIWIVAAILIYLFYNIGFISFNLLSLLLAITMVMLICVIVYISYRVLFGYVLLALDYKKKNLPSGRAYVKKSVALTKGKSFWKFLFISIIFTLLLTPFTNLDVSLETQSVSLRDTLVYNSGLVKNLEPQQVQYYEYITAEYSHLSNDQILDKIESIYYVRVILFFFMYFVFGGLFVYIITSFYSRVLTKKVV